METINSVLKYKRGMFSMLLLSLFFALISCSHSTVDNSRLPANALSVSLENLNQIQESDGSIPQQYWGPAIKSLSPIRVIVHNNNIAVVTNEDAKTISGIYFTSMYSSYLPTTSATQTFTWDKQAKLLRFTFKK
jgi:hypothetical protein